ncbi:MAG: ketoacyl-ACP synthase III [Phycisphaerales bacterium]|nr:ketoacyl-ACP synthase III [Phycisphaerales bacterium]MBT7170587.1 ketoacyl-ACP synthase III [Phycisphaerales bacterium]
MATLRAKIAGTGMALPEKVVDNHYFESIIDTSDEWIVQRTGVRERRHVVEGETTSTLATAAARKAMANAGCEATDLDLIICATITPDQPFPAVACFVQEALGAENVPSMDISAACSGFVYAMATATAFIESGHYKRVLIIGAETLSRTTDFTDRGSCILFGDGAGAAVLEATEEDKGVRYTVMQADGKGKDFIHIPAGGSRTPLTPELIEAKEDKMKMDGRGVYKFAVSKMQWLLGDCMDACGLTPDDIDMVIPHQVNSRIIESATSKHNFPIEKVYTNLDRFGNTSAASVPIALAEAMEKGVVREGMTVLFVAFGAGLTWAGAVVTL